jgi:hypothetical protein
MGSTWPVREMSASRSVGMTALLPLCADFLEILGAAKSCSPEGLSRLEMG